MIQLYVFATLVKSTVRQLFKSNCSVSRGIFDQLGNFFFLLLQDSQDSDDESKCVCKKNVLHSDISHQRSNSQNKS